MMLHLVLRSMVDLDALPAGSWIGIVRRQTFEPYSKEEDGTWWNRGGSSELDPDELIWGARILYLPGQEETPSELAEEDPISAAAAVIANASGTPFIGPDHRAIAAALAAAGMLRAAP